MTKLPAYIVAGGKSTRFGSDKAVALVRGVPLIERIARQLSPCAASVTVVADEPDKYESLGLRTICDIHPGLGPLAGLHAATVDCRQSDWLLLASCDLADVKPAWIDALSAGRTPDVVAVAYRDGEDHSARPQSLLALYHVSIRPIIEERLAQRRLAMHRLIADVPAALLPLPDDWPAIPQFNTRDDLARYLSGSE
ncbi:MAG: molybdenum cofactor guanylyltransferase [Phycisphaerales bacterium]|nr:molybdenum cofactor guanylyltransferase [Phycisphaerales bacterium]